VKRGFKIEWVLLYGMFMFRQPLYLSSIDLFNIVFHSVVVLGIWLFVRMRFRV
jgi:hypothetical protein